jgi:pimeloyl-ACP methyl ester carboxylesterase
LPHTLPLVRWFVAIAIAAVVAVTPTTAAAASPIEARYQGDGPWTVTTSVVNDDSGAPIYDLFYPAHLGQGGVRHPIITWGNGSFAVPTQYLGLLNHLASWGFVIVASTSTTTAKGTEMLAGARYMVARNNDPASVFYRKLDVSQIGAVGHSQGAGGTVNATNKSNGLIKTAVPISLPAPMWVGPGDDYHPSQLAASVFFLGGSDDVVIAGPSTLTGYYNSVPGQAAVAVLKGAGHNTIQGSGGNYLGYVTAWLRYQLAGDAAASAAFVGAAPEINANTAWQNQAEKHLRAVSVLAASASAPASLPVTGSTGGDVAFGALALVLALVARRRSLGWR